MKGWLKSEWLLVAKVHGLWVTIQQGDRSEGCPQARRPQTAGGSLCHPLSSPLYFLPFSSFFPTGHHSFHILFYTQLLLILCLSLLLL